MSWINFLEYPLHKHLNQLVLINETNAELSGNSNLMEGHSHTGKKRLCFPNLIQKCFRINYNETDEE